MSANSCSYLAKWQPYDHNFNTITSRKTTTKTVHILQVFSLYFDCTTLRNEREVLIFFFFQRLLYGTVRMNLKSEFEQSYFL